MRPELECLAPQIEEQRCKPCLHSPTRPTSSSLKLEDARLPHAALWMHAIEVLRLVTFDTRAKLQVTWPPARERLIVDATSRCYNLRLVKRCCS